MVIMSVLIIGGDNLGTILYKLRQKGFKNIEHISGRKGWDKKISVLLKVEKADLVIILVDYINHCVVKNTKEKIRSSNAKAIFSKRSWVWLEDPVNNFVAMQKNA
jgi:hypothetical protein